MKVLGIIPARNNSKRLPNKNILNFAGKPLVQHIMETAIKTEILDTIVVSSDSSIVLNIAKQFEKIIGIKRPDELATDTSPAIRYVNHALSYLNKKGLKYDIIVILQPTSPFTNCMDINSCISKLINSNADSVVSIVKIPHHIHPAKLKRLHQDKLFPYFENESDLFAAEELPDVYIRNCSVYVSWIKTIQSGQIIGDDCRGVIMPRERSVDINDFFDFKYAEYLYKNNLLKDSAKLG